MRLELKKLHLLMLVETFDERYLHQKFKDYHCQGEWFEFEEDFFFSNVLPQCEEYFADVEALEGRPYTTNRTLKSLLSDVDEELEKVQSEQR